MIRLFYILTITLQAILTLPALAQAPAKAKLASLAIQVHHRENNTPLHLDSFRYQTAQAESYALTRLSYILSGFSLEKTDGTLTPLTDQHAWIDLKQNNQFTLNNIPLDNYQALHFHVGLDPITNYRDPNQYPANHPLSSLRNLHWTKAEGYIFLAIEGHQLTAQATQNTEPKTTQSPTQSKQGFVYHLANDNNLASIRVPYSLDLTAVDNNYIHPLSLNFDLHSLFHSSNPIHFAKDGHISHSKPNDTIAKKLKSNLTKTFSLTPNKNTKPNTKSTKQYQASSPLYMPEQFNPYPFTIPNHIPIPVLPTDNPLITERVDLGKILFHDKRLSKDNTLSCASCHQLQHALSDPRPKSTGVNGALGLRNSMPLQNLAWKEQFFWDGRINKLRDQVISPITDPSEMHQDLTLLPEKIKDLSPLFSKAFNDPNITTEKITLALESHLHTLTSLDSKFDQATQGKAKLTEQEERGFKLFFTEHDPKTKTYGADCFHCHNGPFFTDNSFHDTGLPSIVDKGLERVTGKLTDQFKFLTPGLRNVELTAPYMHDGRFETLEEVIDHYDHTHAKTPNLDPNLSKHGTKGLQLSDQDKADIIAFLKTLTDPKFK